MLHMREVLGAMPTRGPHDVPAMIAVQNFKGGVGKSTVTTHLAHYFAVQGYRVLVVDCDSQATTTTLFGFNPHFNITREETLYPTSDRPDPGRPALCGQAHALAQCRSDPVEP
jgi:chromosome partitioning protein